MLVIQQALNRGSTDLLGYQRKFCIRGRYTMKGGGGGRRPKEIERNEGVTGIRVRGVISMATKTW